MFSSLKSDWIDEGEMIETRGRGVKALRQSLIALFPAEVNHQSDRRVTGVPERHFLPDARNQLREAFILRLAGLIYQTDQAHLVFAGEQVLEDKLPARVNIYATCSRRRFVQARGVGNNPSARRQFSADDLHL